ncbi:hypothetical protein T439DRAFT_325553 [Meredithblackwellia eburnea MCA 4105]
MNFGAWLCLANALILIPYVVFYHHVYIHKADQHWMATWNSVIWLPIVLQGYLFAFANWHSHAVICESQGKKWPSWLPIVSDVVYFGGLVLLIAFSITVQVLTSNQWQTVWTQYQQMRAALLLKIPTWTPELSRTNPLQGQFEIMFKAANKMENYDTIMMRIYGIILVFTAFLNASILSVFLIIRSQLKIDFENFHAQGQVPSQTSSAHPLNQSESQSRGYTTVLGTNRMASNFRTASRSAVGIGAGVFTREMEDEQIERRQKLRYAASNTVSSGILISLAWLLFGVICLWSSSIPCLSFDGAVSHLKLELSHLLIVWAYTIIITLTCVRLTIESIRFLPSSETGVSTLLPSGDSLETWFERQEQNERRRSVVSGIQCGRETEVVVEMHQTGKVVQMEVFERGLFDEEVMEMSTGDDVVQRDESGSSDPVSPVRRGSKVTFL